VQVIVLPGETDAGQMMPTLETTLLSVIVATPEMSGSWVLVARTVTELPVVGVVKTPAEVMLPAVVVQVTPEE
jgi:hypothetical protein